MNKREKKEVILKFIENNFDSVDQYLKGISRMGLIEELRLYGITVQPHSNITTKTLRKIYKDILEDLEEQ